METNGAVKVLFKFYSDLLDQEMVETLWAIPVDASLGYFKIDSLPFYVSSIATDDMVHAEYSDEDGMLLFKQTVKPSGNSIVWVVITDEDIDIEEVRDIFFDLDCISDSISDRFFTMEVKNKTNYLFIKDKLNYLKSEGWIDYTEPCLSAQHQY